MIYFAWCDEKDNFSKEKHKTEEEKVFHIEIIQEEKFCAIALLTISTACVEGFVGQKKSMWVSWEREGHTVPLFKGKFSGFIRETKGELSVIELVAEPGDRDKKLSEILKSLKKTNTWDELFIKDEHKDHLEPYMNGQLSNVYWDRCSHEASLSNMFEGEILHLGGNFDRDSLVVQHLQTPCRAVHLRIHAQWIQKSVGMANIFSRIARYFKQGFVNSLTGIDFANRWPKSGLKLGKSGYGIGTSNLETFRPYYTGMLGIYPRHSGPHSVIHEDGTQRKVVFPRHWYRGKLYLHWRYRQKRHETLELTLTHGVQNLSQGSGETKVIDVTLQNIYPPGDAMIWHPKKWYRRGAQIAQKDGQVLASISSHYSGAVFDPLQWKVVRQFHGSWEGRQLGTFFLTPRGQDVAEVGLLMARRELALSSRAVGVSLRGSWELLSCVTTHHMVTVSDPRLPGGQIVGKVTRYRIVCDGESGERFVEISLACSVGKKSQNISVEGSDPVFDDGVVLDDAVCSGKARQIEDMYYLPYHDQKPRGGIVNMRALEAHKMIRGVHIKNPAEEQGAALSRCKTLSEMEGVLREKRTTLRMLFFDLRTQPCLRHTIKMDIPKPWEPPQHVNFE